MTEQVRVKPEDIEKQVESLLREKYTPRDYLLIFKEIYRAQSKTEKKLRLRDLCPPVSREAASRRLERGLSVLDEEKLRFDERELTSLLERLKDILAAHDGGGKLVAEKLLEAEKAGEVSLKTLAKAVIKCDAAAITATAEKLSLPPDGLLFIARLFVHPFLRVCARSTRRKVNLEEALTETCPICGGAPLMARLRPSDGKRVFGCSLCGTEWVFKRLQCPCCGNEDAEKLGFFFADGDTAYRVDKCDECRRYIKTSDERKNAEGEAKSLALLDAATLYLDILAEKEGYQSLQG